MIRGSPADVISPKLLLFSADTLHRHRFLDLTELQRHGERRVRADLEDDAGLHVGAESLQYRLEPVRSDRQILQHVRSPFVGHRRPGQPRVRLRHRDRHARQGEAGLIADRAVDLREAGRLGPGAAGCGDEQDQQARTKRPATA
jgi:hypothetical protein